MATKIGINGFGRIGRNVFKLLMKNPAFEVAAINDLTSAKVLAHLLKYDSVSGKYKGTVEAKEDAIVVDGKEIKITKIKNPAEIPWGAMGVEMVLESTGIFRAKEQCMLHIAGGAKKVLLSVPPKDAIDHPHQHRRRQCRGRSAARTEGQTGWHGHARPGHRRFRG